MSSSSLLVFKDSQGNEDQYTLKLPQGMLTWRVDAFLDFLTQGHDSRTPAGYLAEPIEALHFEHLRLLVLKPEWTFNRLLGFSQQGRQLGPDDSFDLSLPVNYVTLNRCLDQGPPVLSAISTQQANLWAFESCRNTMVEAFDHLFDFKRTVIQKRDTTPVTSLTELIGCFEDVLDDPNQLSFFYHVASLIHTLPFETLSKIQAGIQCRSGWEMWGQAGHGWGGVCAEKTAMLKFVCDILKVPNHPVLGSASPIPADLEEIVHRYLASEGQEELPLWIQHHILEVCLSSGCYLIDVTGGNMPLLFVNQQDAQPWFNAGMRARMVYRTERLTLARASDWVGEALLTLSQYHVPELHLQYIFKQGLGLSISRDLFVGVYFDWGGERSFLQQNHYACLAKQAGYPYPRFIHQDNLHAIPDEALQNQLKNTLAALRLFYENKDFTGDFTFVIQPLMESFWRHPRLSREVRACVQESRIDKL
jgi:hypothetical protein